MARLDAKSSGRFDAGVASEYKKTQREYEHVLAKEELHWFQKSRAKWLYMGDRNTKYFHGSTAIKKRKNKYEMLKDENDNQISEDQALESLVTNFYKDLYLDNGIVIPYALNNASPPLEEN